MRSLYRNGLHDRPARVPLSQIREIESIPTTEWYIEFDGQQLLLRSAAAEIIDFASRTYRSGVVASPTTSVGSIEVQHSNGKFVFDLADGSPFRGDLQSVCRYLKQQVQLRFVQARSDLVWLHAGAVERHGKCLVIAGPTACGKSNLVTLLCERGWRMISDDVAPLRIDTLEVLPYPEYPMRRIYPGRDLPRDQIGLLEREIVHLSNDAICREAAKIGGVVFPIFRDGNSPELVRLPSGEVAVELLRSCMNFVHHKAVAVTIASRIATAVHGNRLVYGDALDAASILDRFSWVP